MTIFSDEMILYVGLIIASASMLTGAIYFVIYKMRKGKLDAKFDAEYGRVQKE